MNVDALKARVKSILLKKRVEMESKDNEYKEKVIPPRYDDVYFEGIKYLNDLDDNNNLTDIVLDDDGYIEPSDITEFFE